MTTRVEIDENSGFCFGVVNAIKKAEEALEVAAPIYCIGDIVHNSDEVERLRGKGLLTITHEEMGDIDGATVLLRAHGEPPSTYEVAQRQNIKIIDATCPVVLQLQRRVKECYDAKGDSCQIVIYGKPGHAEVNGLVGQTDGHAIVIQGFDDLDKIDFSKDIELYSQTTKSLNGFREITEEISHRVYPGVSFRSYDTICRQVANRVDRLREFASRHSLVLFVSGEKSSNGRFLYSECRSVNPSTMLISNETKIDRNWLMPDVESIGICGATSTPRWLMERVKDRVTHLLESKE